MTTIQKNEEPSEYPGTALAVAIAGAALMIVSGVLILGVSLFLFPGINGFLGHDVHLVVSGNTTTAIISNSTTYTFAGPNHWWGNGTFPFQSGVIPGFVSGIIDFVGAMGVISGTIVLVSALMLRSKPHLRTTWGALIVVFSVLSFFGFGGFVLGAILGIIGGILALTWKPRTTSYVTSPPPTSAQS